MKIVKRPGLAVMGIILAAGITGPAMAKVTQYECRFTQERARGGGWIPEMLILTEDDTSGEIVVFDPVIKHFIGTPIPAKLSARTKLRATYKWEVDVQNRGQAARMIYTFSYTSDGRPARVTVQPGGYDNSWSGDGTCKVSAG
jgi:hypothetical protein